MSRKQSAPTDAPTDDTHAPSSAPAATEPPAAPSRLPRFLREKTALWLYVATGFGAFFNLLGFVFVISPYNRQNLLYPNAEELAAVGLNASQIADRLAYASQISPMMLNGAAGVFFACMISLLVAFRRYRSGIYAYILLTFVMIGITAAHGLFTPALLMVPTAVTVTAAMNKEFLR